MIKSVIVVGASAGGLRAVAELASYLDHTIEAAVVVVLHASNNSIGSVLVNYIRKYSSLPCELASDELLLKNGHVYIAQPDFHIMVKDGMTKVIKGPHENRWRPSIDVLFRSAAAHYNIHAIGIILSGLMDDGVAGMAAIKRSGGHCIVQEPHEAEFADMPLNVLDNVEVDYRLPISEISDALKEILKMPTQEEVSVPEEIKLETAINERMITRMEDLEKLGAKSDFVCPDCGGGLWEIHDSKMYRYRCYSGHAYTEKLLLDKQSEELEEALWVSIRMLEERKHLLIRMGTRQKEKGGDSTGEVNLQMAKQAEMHISKLKELLMSINKSGPSHQGFA